MNIASAIATIALLTGPTQSNDSIRTLEEFEVSARAVSETTKSSTPVFGLDAREMRSRGILNISDAMRRLPGVTLKDYGGAGGMKTVAVRGLGAQHTGVSIDGVPISDARSGQIDLSRYSLDNLSGIRLLIGDGDDIFIPARNASTPSLLEISTQTINFSSTFRHRLTARLNAGSFKHFGGYLNWQYTPSGKFSMGINGEYIYAKNNYPFTLHNINLITHERRNNSRMKSATGDLNICWRPTGRVDFHAKAHYYDSDRQLPGQVRYYTNFSRETLHERNFFAQAGMRSRLSSVMSLRADLKYNWDNSSYRDPSYPGGVRDADYYQREAYATATVMAAPHSDWVMAYAADYVNTSLTTFQVNNPDKHPLRHTIYQTLTVRFNNGRLAATGRLLHTLAHNTTRTGTSARDAKRLSPSLSASFKLLPAENIYIRASYKDIFRLPTFTESYYLRLGNAELRPETTSQFNIGATWESNSGIGKGVSVRLTADGYVNLIRDMIVAVPYNMFIWNNINIGKATAKGIDVTANIAIPLGIRQVLTLNGNWSWQRVLNRTNPKSSYYGYQPAYMPVNSGAGSITWENPWVDVTLSGTGVSSRWSTSQHSDDTRIDGYADFNLTLQRSFRLPRSQSLDLRLDLRNLLNTQYEVIRLYPMPRFNYMLSITWNLQG